MELPENYLAVVSRCFCSDSVSRSDIETVNTNYRQSDSSWLEHVMKDIGIAVA